MISRYLQIIILIIISQGLLAQGQTVYVTDQIQVGLHTDKSLQSPIIKLIPSGTALEMVKQEAELSFVRDQTGTGGWVDTSYLSEFTSADPKLQEAEDKISKLEASLNNARQGQTSEEIDNLMGQLEVQATRIQQLSIENETLNRQINSNNPDSLYEKIEQLSTDKRQLETQLANILESASLPDTNQDSESTESLFTAKNLLIFTGIMIILGAALGIYIMDFINRKRHGGFRV